MAQGAIRELPSMRRIWHAVAGYEMKAPKCKHSSQTGNKDSPTLVGRLVNPLPYNHKVSKTSALQSLPQPKQAGSIPAFPRVSQ